jgi:hypothetical protein
LCDFLVMVWWSHSMSLEEFQSLQCKCFMKQNVHFDLNITQYVQVSKHHKIHMIHSKYVQHFVF